MSTTEHFPHCNPLCHGDEHMLGVVHLMAVGQGAYAELIAAHLELLTAETVGVDAGERDVFSHLEVQAARLLLQARLRRAVDNLSKSMALVSVPQALQMVIDLDDELRHNGSGPAPETPRPPRSPLPRRGMNGGVDGTFVTCRHCDGDGILHVPDAQPDVVQPEPQNAPELLEVMRAYVGQVRHEPVVFPPAGWVEVGHWESGSGSQNDLVQKIWAKPKNRSWRGEDQQFAERFATPPEYWRCEEIDVTTIWPQAAG